MKSMTMSDHSIYISHAWGGESEDIVQEIYKRSRKAGLNILLDKKDLRYRESISSFMKNLGQADAIILVVSNKYLHSEYCMYELLQIYENKNILQRIFPVVLDEVSIAKSTERLELVKYWESETENLESKIRELKNLSYIEGITDDLNLYQKIRNNIANMTRILKDINTLNIKLHKDSDYGELISAIEKYITRHEKKNHQEKVTAVHSGSVAEIAGNNSGTAGEVKKSEVKDSSSRNWWTGLFRTWPLLVFAGLMAATIYMWYINGNEEQVGDDQVFNDQTRLKPQNSDPETTDFSAKDPVSKISIEGDTKRPLAAVPVKNKPDKKPTELAGQNEEADKSISNRDEINNSGKESVEKSKVQLVESSGSLGVTDEQSGEQKKNDLVNHGHKTEEGPEEEVVSNPSFVMKEVYVPSSVISVRIPNDISSNKVKEGDLIYLKVDKSLSSDGVLYSKPDARVKARIIDAKASHQGGRAALGLRLEGLETVDGQWLDLSYHDIVERKRGEIVFQKGTLLNDVGIKPTTLNLKIVQ